jgi:hypothetical protein
MKVIPLILAAISINASAQINGFQSFIRQTQQPDTPTGLPVEWDMPVEATGTASSALELNKTGSLFQLWTIEQATAKEYLLDQKLVGAYLPKADIKIKTLDPYALVTRTRVDQPFSVEIKVADLLTGIGMPEAATKVLLEQHVQSYVNGVISLDPATVAANTPLKSSYIAQNGTTVMNFAASSLKASDPTKSLGEEHFIVHALPDGTVTQTQLASAHVQVWPVASGAIYGITPGEQLRYLIPTLQLNLNDLYPRSDTYLMVYEGTQINGVEGKLVKAFPVDRDRSVTTILEVPELSAAIGADGPYTIALMSDTVYGRELLCDPITFSVKRTIAVNAMQVNFEGIPEPTSGSSSSATESDLTTVQ